MNKYIKPQSMTWWVSFLPLSGGVFLATDQFHGMTSLVSVIDELRGDMSAAQMIQLGLLGIGIRGAIPGGNEASKPERY